MAEEFETRLATLREDLRGGMSEKRFAHTCGVEEMAIRLAALYCPEKTNLLRVAALLHDITKENSTEKQLQICREYGIILRQIDVMAPKTLHAMTAAALIPSLYPDWASDEVVSCVRWHTTGRIGMSLGEKLIYLADYIDMTRKFDDCVALRNAFWDADPASMDAREREIHLEKIMLRSFDMTLSGLLESASPISPDSLGARNECLVKLAECEGK